MDINFINTGKAYQAILNPPNASIYRIQRRLKIGYDRAKRLMAALEFLGAVSKPINGKREVLWLYRDN